LVLDAFSKEHIIMAIALATAAATRAYDFVSTLGINTHIDFADYGYQNLTIVEASIVYLGVTNLRDSAQSPADAQTWLQVAQATHAKFDDYIAETSPAGMAADLSYVSQLAAEGILNFIEGGNEEDDSYPAALGNTLQITAQFQQQVYAAGKALGLPVINMSFGAGWTPTNDYQGDYGAVGDLSAYADYGNAHTYPNVGQSTDWAMQRLNGLAKLADTSDPVITTEIGWNESQGFGQTNIAKYVVQAALDGMKDGDVKTYFYGLFDDGSGLFGLMNQDGTAKPAGTAAGRFRCDGEHIRNGRAQLFPGRHHVERQLVADGEVGRQLLALALERSRSGPQRHPHSGRSRRRNQSIQPADRGLGHPGSGERRLRHRFDVGRSADP
jgi:hypothetical protein